MKYIKYLFSILILFFSFSPNTFSKSDIFVFGGMNFFNSSGSESDYKEGENDFPIMDSHSTSGFGFGISFPLKKGFFVGFESNYNMSGKAVLHDPTDNDSVEIDTYRNASLFLTFGMNLWEVSDSFNLFLNSGAGLNLLLDDKTKIYTSKYGYETEILPPENRNNLAGFGGIGFIYRIDDGIGILINARYLYISYDNNPERAFVILGGLNIKF